MKEVQGATIHTCAISTILTMSAITVCCPLCSARTVTVPSQLMVPAVTRSPGVLVAGSGSPVSALSSTVERPDTTTPSTGTRSPGSTASRSPGEMASAGTSRSSPLRRARRARVGTRAWSATMSADACSLARSSRARPRSTNPGGLGHQMAISSTKSLQTAALQGPHLTAWQAPQRMYANQAEEGLLPHS